MSGCALGRDFDVCPFSGVSFHHAGDEIDKCFAFNCNLAVCLFSLSLHSRCCGLIFGS